MIKITVLAFYLLREQEVLPMAKNKKTRKVTVKKKQAAKRNQGMHRVPRANRKYKDTVFRMLFSDKENLLSLYNAINRSVYENPEDLEIVTLENAIYMGMKNDLAFIIDTNLFLYEHQSTYNPNMPLRDLLYISAEYQKIVDHKSLYSSVLQKIPAPYFIVFYNGTEKEEDRWENSLSEAYENLTGEPKLELKVITLNSLQYHLVWCTKYRKKVLKDGIDTECKEMLYDLAEEYKFQILAMEVMPDHIHLLVDCRPQFYISDMIKIMKGNIARQIFLAHPELKKELWGGHLWNPSYCAVTVSDRSREQVCSYIEGQKEK